MLFLAVPRASYHHGDLAAALVKAAVELIEERGLAALSLRECARRAGVSHAAPYRHFEDKNALLLAVALQGSQWLAAAGEAAMAGIADPRKRLDAYGVAYVRFAFEHPVHHRVMFTTELDVPPEQRGEENRAFALLVETAAAVVGPEHDPQQAALAAWSLTHGLSMLILDGRIPAELVRTAEDAENLARSVLVLWRGPLGG
jgi:AcrR family transcriptional regulator